MQTGEPQSCWSQRMVPRSTPRTTVDSSQVKPQAVVSWQLITESRHITAVKKLWRHSNHYEPLRQILLTNQRLDELASACVTFTVCAMLPDKQTTTPQPKLVKNNEDEDRPVDGKIIREVALTIRPHESYAVCFVLAEPNASSTSRAWIPCISPIACRTP